MIICDKCGGKDAIGDLRVRCNFEQVSGDFETQVTERINAYVDLCENCLVELHMTISKFVGEDVLVRPKVNR